MLCTWWYDDGDNDDDDVNDEMKQILFAHNDMMIVTMMMMMMTLLMRLKRIKAQTGQGFSSQQNCNGGTSHFDKMLKNNQTSWKIFCNH